MILIRVSFTWISSSMGIDMTDLRSRRGWFNSIHRTASTWIGGSIQNFPTFAFASASATFPTSAALVMMDSSLLSQ